MTTTATQESKLSPLTQTSEPEGHSGFRHVYREMADRHVEADVIEQLKSNLAQLEDLHGRLKFMMGEISYLLKRG